MRSNRICRSLMARVTLARWIMSELRSGTRESMKRSRRGLAGMLVSIVRRTLWRLPDYRNFNG
jgi:hypothetical protein